MIERIVGNSLIELGYVLFEAMEIGSKILDWDLSQEFTCLCAPEHLNVLARLAGSPSTQAHFMRVARSVFWTVWVGIEDTDPNEDVDNGLEIVLGLVGEIDRSF